MKVLTSLVNLFSFLAVDAEEKLRTKEALFIKFALIATCALFFFNFLNLMAGRYYASALYFLWALSFASFLFHYKTYGRYEFSAQGVVFSSVMLICFQQAFVADGQTLNLLWLPIISFINYFMFTLKKALRNMVISIFIGAISYYMPFAFELSGDIVSQADLIIVNESLIIASNVVALILGYYVSVAHKNALSCVECANEALQREREKNSALLTIMSHDMSNLITTGANYGKILIKHESNDPLVVKSIEKVNNSFKMMKQVTEEVRSIKALEVGKIDVMLDSVDLIKSIRDAIDVNELRWQDKNIQINFNFTDEPCFIQAETVSLVHSVFSNLISNAIKFSAENDIVEISVVRRKNNTEVTVRDYGIGIPKKIMENLFDPTVKTTRVGTSGEKGTGFGMPLAKMFLDRYGASIQVESFSGDNHGTKFTLSFENSAEDQTFAEEFNSDLYIA
jgi:signal transduction histidine kinase